MPKSTNANALESKHKVLPKPHALKCTDAEWREGHRRAIAMLRDLRDTSLDETDCEDDCRDGRPQENVAYSHLLGMMSAKSNGVLVAFSSVITTYIGGCERMGVPDIDSGRWAIAKMMRAPIPTQVGRESRAKIRMRSFAEVANGQA
jgi:hypothetical protein